MSAMGDAPGLVALDDAVERERADVYGMLARLWSAPPDAALVAELERAPGPAAGSFLHEPWQALVAALHAAGAQDAADEYDRLFVGVGRPEVILNGSYYLTGFLHETPLAALRSDLQELGLTRDPRTADTEDHIAFVCEVMRWLIAGDDIERCNLERQRRFWRAHVQPWVERMCDAVQAHEAAQVYAAVAGYTRAFAQVETQALDMME
jgi:TorA maturation chaperone TorD